MTATTLRRPVAPTALAALAAVATAAMLPVTSMVQEAPWLVCVRAVELQSTST